jgi:hypothetical protein
MTLRRRYEIGFALIFLAATLSTQLPSTQFDAGLIRATVDSLASIIRQVQRMPWLSSELPPRTFCTFLRELSSRRRPPP